MRKIFIILYLLISFSLFSQVNDNNYNNGNGSIIDTLKIDNQTWILRKHEGTYCTDRQFKVYENFLQESSNKIVYTINQGEKISTLGIISNGVERDSDTWIKVINNENKAGWIQMDKDDTALNNPYRDNDWMILDVININGKELTVRKLAVGGLIDSGFIVRDAPSLNGNALHRISGRENTLSFSGSAIIEETEKIDRETDHWIKYDGYYERKNDSSNCFVKTEDITGGNGWVFGGYVYTGKGGPKYYTPEIMVKYFFAWYI